MANTRIANKKRVRILLASYTRNALKCSKGKAESLPHKFTKFLLYNWGLENRLDSYFEVEFMRGGRSDCVFPELAVAVEVTMSEDEETFRLKNYPIDTLKIKAVSEFGSPEFEALKKELEARL